MFSKGKDYKIVSSDIQGKVTEHELLGYYLGVFEVPCVINNPYREDNNPSLGLYSNDGISIRFKDYATKEAGGIYDLLGRMWNTDYSGVLSKIYNDLPQFGKGTLINKVRVTPKDTFNKYSDLKCKVRKWEDYDIEYWMQYNIPLDWLEFAEVYPISYKIVIKNNKQYVFPADKYAYVFVENKEGHTSLKIYQPYNTQGYKWANKNDGSVIGLWTKLPETGDKVCICSSLKDALCLWANTGIPSVYLQGEGYNMSSTAVNELKRRFLKVYVLFDNDKAGLEDGEKLSQEWDFINIVLPHFDEGKDISDFMKAKGGKVFYSTLISLLDTIN